VTFLYCRNSGAICATRAGIINLGYSPERYDSRIVAFFQFAIFILKAAIVAIFIQLRPHKPYL
jgi:hypothetical protein